MRHIPCAVAELDDWVLRDGIGHVEIGFKSLSVARIADHEITALAVGRIIFDAHAREIGELEHRGRSVFKGCEERRETIEFHKRGGGVHAVFRGGFKRYGLR